jgi:hypothetical protein
VLAVVGGGFSIVVFRARKTESIRSNIQETHQNPVVI